MAHSAAEYARQLMDLLPRGRVWNPEADSKLRGVLLAIGEELARVDARGLNLIDESDPRTASETIEQWEAMLSLPDERVTTIPATQAARRLAITQKYTERGGQSVQFFVDLALACGYVLATQGLATPASVTLDFGTAGGTLAPGTYAYRIAALNGAGESAASAPATVVVPAGTVTNFVRIYWDAIPGATGYRIYGRTLGTERLIDIVGAAVSSFDDPGTAIPVGDFRAAATEPITLFANDMFRCGVSRCGDRLYSVSYAYSMQLNVMPVSGVDLPVADFERVIRHVCHSHITVIFLYL